MNENTEFTGEYYYPQHNNFRIPLKHQSQEGGSEYDCSSLYAPVFTGVLDNEPEAPIFQTNRFQPRAKYLGKRRNELFGSSGNDHQLFPSPPDEDVPMPEVSSPKKPRIGSALRTMLQEEFPEELKALLKPLHCELCNAQLNSIVSSNIHYESKTHEKKLNHWLQDWSRKSGLPIPERRQKILNTEGVVGPNAYRCVACDIPLTSIHDARAHYSGRKHRAVVEGNSNPSGSGYYNHDGQWVRQSTKVNQQDSSGRFGIGEAFNHPPPPPPVSAVSEESTSTPLITSSLLFCSLCNISVTSESQMKDHMEGAKHLKKLKTTTEATVPPMMGEDTIMESVVQCGKSPPKRDISIHRTPSGNYYCKICDITAPNELQFRQHLSSKKHLKRSKGNQA
ncbi:uncharacterized protein DMENIID0001_164230 [Sergentomyia squamirostris]